MTELKAYGVRRSANERGGIKTLWRQMTGMGTGHWLILFTPVCVTEYQIDAETVVELGKENGDTTIELVEFKIMEVFKKVDHE